MLSLWEYFWSWGVSASATNYYDFSAGVNGIGTPASPYNTYSGHVPNPGEYHLFKRGTTCNITNFALVSGTSGSPIFWGAWYNADGSDDESQPKPIVNCTTGFSTYASPKDYTIIDSWDIRAKSLTVANDKSVVFLGTGSTINNCTIDTNVGGIGAWGKSNVTITNNTVMAVGHTSANANNGIIVSDSVNMSNVTVSGNTVLHYGGGNANSNAMRLETTIGASGALTGLTVYNNTIRPAHVFQRMLPGGGFINETENTNETALANRGFVNESDRIYCRNHSAIGIRLSRCPAAQVTYNTISGMLEGIWLNGGGAATNGTYAHNLCTYNMHFGLHYTTDAIGCTVEYNTCSHNGINISDGILFAYGRGIEFSSAAGQSRCSGHLVRFNTCDYNFNWGGSLDNATEGCGIGLDDATNNCILYGNTLRYNEGNGIQYWGNTIGAGTPAISDTGGNNCTGNLFINNGTNSFENRRSGGTYRTLNDAHIGTGNTRGTQTLITNNVFVGGRVGVSQNYLCLNILIANNIFVDTAHAIQFSTLQVPVGYGTYNNDFFSDAVSIQKYSSNAIDGNGEPTFPSIAYVGTNDYTFDPLLDTNYIPNASGPAIDTGYTVGTIHDYLGAQFATPPDIGMYEVAYVEPPQPPGPSDDGSGRSQRGGGHHKGAGHKKEYEYEALSDEYWEEREARMSEHPSKIDPMHEPVTSDLSVTPPVLQIDQAVANALQAATMELESLRSNLLKVPDVEQLKVAASRIRELDASIPALKAKLWTWTKAKYT